MNSNELLKLAAARIFLKQGNWGMVGKNIFGGLSSLLFLLPMLAMGKSVLQGVQERRQAPMTQANTAIQTAMTNAGSPQVITPQSLAMGTYGQGIT